MALEDDDDPHSPCGRCGEEHPDGVLEDGLCPPCYDEDVHTPEYYDDLEMDLRRREALED